jgi:hypothetical protein
VRVVARLRPDQEADHDGLACRERACGQNHIALAVGRAAQLDALLLRKLVAVHLALREHGDLPSREPMVPGGLDG